VDGSDVPNLALEDVAQARLVAQRLAEPNAPTPAEAVQWLTAMQAQDYTGALTSVGLRTHRRPRAEVVVALDTGDIVRSWPMRGTLHLTAAQDLSWMLRLLAPRVIRGSVARRTGLGLDEPQLERARELSIDALSGSRQLRRADLLASWNKAGLDPGGQRGVHVLRYLAMTALWSSAPPPPVSSWSSCSTSGSGSPGTSSATRRSASWPCATSAATARPRPPTSPAGAG